MDQLFDEQRFNKRHLKEDFNIDDLKKLAEKAKMEIEGERLRAAKP